MAATLAERFGRKSRLFSRCAGAFYRSLLDSRCSEARRRLEEWLSFSRVLRDLEGPSARELAALATSLSVEGSGFDPAALVFSVETYYALVVKLMCLKALSCAVPPRGGKPESQPAALASEALRRFLYRHLVQGEAFRDAGLTGFVEEDPYCWYLERWTPTVQEALREALAAVDSLPGGVLYSGRDWFKPLYLALFPARLRRRLGEHYTPDWLAERLLDRLEEEGFFVEPGKRFLDPSCGSGTFLVKLIRRLRRRAEAKGLGKSEILKPVLTGVAGMDRHPLAVAAARANYLMAVADLLAFRRGEIAIPVFRSDAVLPGDRAACLKDFDAVVGNPPWVNWENLPEEYRGFARSLWERYGLFPHRGMDVILGKGKKDFSMLFTYVCLDRYLRPGGALAFVITPSVFKAPGAGQGFRRFLLPGGAPVGVRVVEDLGEVGAFGSAGRRTALAVMVKGEPPRYPVPYWRWRPRLAGSRILPEAGLAEVLERVEVLCLSARPVDRRDPTSSWITAPPKALEALGKLLGPSDYRAREGVNTGGANGVFWLEVLGERPGGLAAVKNLPEMGKLRVPRAMAAVEKELLYPLLRRGDVGRWRAAPSAWLLLSQDPVRRRGIAEEEMARRWPRAYAYLKRFEPVLRARAAYRRYFVQGPFGRPAKAAPYYSLFDVGEYSLAPYKVVWPRIASELAAAVVGPREGKPLLPQETLTFVGLEDPEEAYYLCALLNSFPFDLAARLYSPAGGKSFASPHLLQYLRVPKFEASDPLHRNLAGLSREAHALADAGKHEELARLEDELTRLAAAAWGLEERELEELLACRRYF